MKLNKKGFTLIEIMTALGIMSALVLVVMQAQRSAINSTGDLKVTSEVNNLYQTLTTELSRMDTCNANFANKASGYSPTFISNKNNVNKIIEVGKAYGEEITIQGIAVTASATANVWNLTVTYQPHLKDPVTKNPVAPRNFVLPITAYTDGSIATPKIKSCYSDVHAMIEKAVMYACDTSHGIYTAGTGTGIGTCNSDFEVRGQGGAAPIVSGPNYMCPDGEFLQKVTLSPTSKNLVFQCTSALNAVDCKPWEYINGFNAVTGKANCLDIRSIFTSGTATGLMVTRAGVYTNVTLDCSNGGTTNTKILQSISATGVPNCVDPYISLACPVGKFLTGIDYTTTPGTGTPICDKVTNDVPAGCPAGSYMTAVDTVGNVTCKSGTLTCGASQYISGINGSADPNCVTMP